MWKAFHHIWKFFLRQIQKYEISSCINLWDLQPMGNLPCWEGVWKSILSQMPVYRSVISAPHISVVGLNEWGLSLEHHLKECEYQQKASLLFFWAMCIEIFALFRYQMAAYWTGLIDSLPAQGKRDLQQIPADALDRGNWEARTGYSSRNHVQDWQSWRTFKVSRFSFYIKCVSSFLWN